MAHACRISAAPAMGSEVAELLFNLKQYFFLDGLDGDTPKSERDFDPI